MNLNKLPSGLGAKRAKGKVVVLHGTAFSGKTSIAKDLLKLLPESYEHVGISIFIDEAIHDFAHNSKTAPDKLIKQMLRVHYMNAYNIPWHADSMQDAFQKGASSFDTIWQTSIEKMVKYIQHCHETGKNLLLECVLTKDTSFEKFVAATKDLNVAFIKVDCPANILAEREMIRKTKPFGWAQGQYKFVHRYNNTEKVYDLSVNSHTNSVSDCAKQIHIYLANNVTYHAITKNDALIEKVTTVAMNTKEAQDEA